MIKKINYVYNYNFILKILDKYIIRYFITTFILISIFLLLISITIDLSQRLHRIYENNGSIKNTLFYYYPNWSLWLFTTLSPIIVFITIIIFTSILKNNNEILAINSSGISINRLFIPYLFISLILSFIFFYINNFLLPNINKSKNKFYYEYMLPINKKNKNQNNKKVILMINYNEYIFIENFDKKKYIGTGFTYQKFKGQKLIHTIISEYIYWNNKIKKYLINNYIERFITDNNKNILYIGRKKKINLKITPQELLPEEYLAETLTTINLKELIQNEKLKGRKNINIYLNELYQRYSISISIILLTILSFYISSYNNMNYEKNIIMSIIMSFIYIFSVEIFKSISINGYTSSLFAILAPHVIFMLIMIIYIIFINNNY